MINTRRDIPKHGDGMTELRPPSFQPGMVAASMAQWAPE